METLDTSIERIAQEEHIRVSEVLDVLLDVRNAAWHAGVIAAVDLEIGYLPDAGMMTSTEATDVLCWVRSVIVLTEHHIGMWCTW